MTRREHCSFSSRVISHRDLSGVISRSVNCPNRVHSLGLCRRHWAMSELRRPHAGEPTGPAPTVRVPTAQLARMRAAASAAGVSLAEWCRRAYRRQLSWEETQNAKQKP